jgi:hypothetical protein
MWTRGQANTRSPDVVQSRSSARKMRRATSVCTGATEAGTSLRATAPRGAGLLGFLRTPCWLVIWWQFNCRRMANTRSTDVVQSRSMARKMWAQGQANTRSPDVVQSLSILEKCGPKVRRTLGLRTWCRAGAQLEKCGGQRACARARRRLARVCGRRPLGAPVCLVSCEPPAGW